MDWSTVGNVAQTIAAVAAVITIAWGVFEYRRRQLEDLDERCAEIRGVSLTFRLLRPRRFEIHDGRGSYQYQWTLHNPGRLPVRHASVKLSFPGDIARVHGDISGTKEEPQDWEVLSVPVIEPHGSYTWKRDYEVPYELWDQMASTTAKITFHAPDGGPYETAWPYTPEQPIRRLQTRLNRRVRT